MSLPQDLIRYLETLRIGQGRLAGERFRVFGWQARFIRGALAPGVFESALTMSRGGGKTTFTAGLACGFLDGPAAQPGSEIVLVAASLQQARIAFRHCQRFLGDRGRDRALFRMWDSPNRSAIYSRERDVLLELKGANPATLHGLAPALILTDEMAVWPPNKLDAMVSALDTSLGKIPGGRFWKIGTRPASESHPFALALKGGADYVQVHAARPGDPPFQKRTWARACPSLPWMPDLEQKIRAEAKKAKLDPSALASFKALRLNLGVADTVESTLVSAEVWQKAEGEADPVGPVYFGVDLGTSASSSAVAAYWPKSGRLDVLAAFPSLPPLGERGLRDGVGQLYQQQQARGELLTTPGHATDPAILLREAVQRYGRPVSVAADRWREAELRDALLAAGVSRTAFSLRGMGYKDGSEDVRAFRRGLLEGKVTPVVSLLLRAALAEARTVSDPAGNQKLAKGSEGQRRQRATDDAAAASILAVAEGLRRGRGPARRGLRVAVARG